MTLLLKTTSGLIIEKEIIVADLTLVKNDVGFNLNFVIKDAEGAAYDLTAHTIEFHLSDKDYKNKVTGSCVITDAAAGKCKYTIAADDLNQTPGPYLIELQLTAGAKKISNPTKITVDIVDECG
jgi:hypothetical protein